MLKIALFLILLSGVIIITRKLLKTAESELTARRYKKYSSQITQNDYLMPDHYPPKAIKLEDKLWHEEETKFVFKLHEEIATTLERQKASEHIVESINKFFYVEKVILLSINNESENFEIEHSIGLKNDETINFNLSKKDGISGFIAAQKAPLMINDLEKEGFLKNINKEPYLKKSFIGVPLIFQNQVLGIIYICDKKPDKEFSDKEFSLMVNIAKVAAIIFKNILLHEDIQNEYLKTITALALALDARDQYTRRHSENVAKYAMAIADEMNFSAPVKRDLHRAALLHDIGKIGIKDSILLCERRLTPEEFEQIKLHPVKGEEIIKPLVFLKEAAKLVRHHHERCDGSGYPDGLDGNKIESGAKILAVADTFDAMHTDRPYRKALPLEKIIAEIAANENNKFDPKIVETFLKIIENNPELIK
ncbi:MAG: phosphohydrolase [Candidatus Omnitrophica bacterium CG11_big_fil_rev_8_21_14_0_20_42_13]|uniref:Phosphohydrolase n=1 Tax=Candidatus Ghiorseimicrobium undicola TaxID=1974746 RepID=A0A2H0LYQ2_9BACT|nr:MAG: phosphohydrolase [Candidatus Omnitrophica bacterium CG11_big_fil_rev_8_21_14_0_20_42_13]